MIVFASEDTRLLTLICKPKQSIGIRNKLPYIPRVKDQDINKVALIAAVLMIVIVVTTQWENIASLVKSPEPLKPDRAQNNQTLTG